MAELGSRQRRLSQRHRTVLLLVDGRRSEAQRIWSEAKEKAPENEALLKTMQRLKP